MSESTNQHPANKVDSLSSEYYNLARKVTDPKIAEAARRLNIKSKATPYPSGTQPSTVPKPQVQPATAPKPQAQPAQSAPKPQAKATSTKAASSQTAKPKAKAKQSSSARPATQTTTQRLAPRSQRAMRYEKKELKKIRNLLIAAVIIYFIVIFALDRIPQSNVPQSIVLIVHIALIIVTIVLFGSVITYFVRKHNFKKKYSE